MIKEKLKSAWNRLCGIGRWIKRNAKALAVATITTVLAAQIYQPIPADLKLKAPRDRILFSRQVEIFEFSTTTGKRVKIRDEVSYLYASDKLVPQAHYEGKAEDMSKRTKNAQFFKKSETEEIARIYTGEPFFEDETGWYQTENATTTLDAFEKQMKTSRLEELIKPVWALTTTTYSGAGDGGTWWNLNNQGQPSQTHWDTAHDQTDGVGTTPTTADHWPSRVDMDGTNNRMYIFRGFFPIDTSVLPDTAVISAAILKLYITDKLDLYNGTGYDYVALVQTTQASTSTLITEDFDQCGDIDNAAKGSANIDITVLSTSAYNDFTLNATGTSWISKTGWTMLGMRDGYDQQDVFPGDPGEAIKNQGIKNAYSEAAGTSTDPYLEITYTVPSVRRIFEIY